MLHKHESNTCHTHLSVKSLIHFFPVFRSSGDLLQLCLQLRSLFQRALELRRGHRGCFTIRRLDSQSAARCPTTQCTTKRGNPWKLPYIFPTLNWFDPPKKWIIYSTDPWYTAVSWKLHWPTDLPLYCLWPSCLIFDVHRQRRQPPAEITRFFPSKHHRWPPGCLSLWQRDNLFAIGLPAFEESTWRTNHPEMAGS